MALLDDYAGVVDEHVAVIVLREDALRQVTHGRQRGEVRQVGAHLLAARLVPHLLERSLEAFGAAAVQQHSSALRRELSGDALCPGRRWRPLPVSSPLAHLSWSLPSG